MQELTTSTANHFSFLCLACCIYSVNGHSMLPRASNLEDSNLIAQQLNRHISQSE